MKIIDFHTHLYPDPVALAALPQMHEYCKIPYRASGTCQFQDELMQKAGIALSVNLPVCTNPKKAESLNSFAEKIAHQAHHASFGSLHPADPNWREELRRFRKRGLIGLKLHNDYQDFFFDSPECIRMIEAAFEENLMVLVHAGADPVSTDMHRCTPAMIAKHLPLLRQGVFIAAHMGGHLMLDDAMQYVIGQDIYIDTSMAPIYYPDEKCRQAILAHDPEKILFGSDSPWDDPAMAIRILRGMELGHELEEKIFYKNAERLLAAANCTETLAVGA